MGELPLAYSEEFAIPNGTNTYNFTLKQATTVEAFSHNGNITLKRNGLALTSGASVSRPLPQGSYSLEVTGDGGSPLLVRTSNFSPPTRLEADVWGGQAIHLNWDDNTDVEAYYRIDRWTRLGWRRGQYVPANYTAAVMDNLVPGYATTYRVSAVTATGESLRSANTITAMTSTEDTSGWYKVNLTQGMSKGEAGWDADEDGLQIASQYRAGSSSTESTWVYASSWQVAAWTVVAGTASVEVTYDSGGRTKDDIVTHNFPSGGDFKVGTGKEISESDGVSNFKLTATDAVKYIALEDSYGAIDRDYDDFYWKLETEYVRGINAILVDQDDANNEINQDSEKPLYVRIKWDSFGAGSKKIAMLDLQAELDTDVADVGALRWELVNDNVLMEPVTSPKIGAIPSEGVVSLKIRPLSDLSWYSSIFVYADQNNNGARDEGEIFTKLDLQLFDIEYGNEAVLSTLDGIDPGTPRLHSYPSVVLPTVSVKAGNVKTILARVWPPEARDAIMLRAELTTGAGAIEVEEMSYPPDVFATVASSGTEELETSFRLKPVELLPETGAYFHVPDRVNVHVRPARVVDVHYWRLQRNGIAVTGAPTLAEVQTQLNKVFEHQVNITFNVQDKGVKNFVDSNSNGKYDVSEKLSAGDFAPHSSSDIVLIATDEIGPYLGSEVAGFREANLAYFEARPSGSKDYGLFVMSHEVGHALGRSGHNARHGLMIDGRDSVIDPFNVTDSDYKLFGDDDL